LTVRGNNKEPAHSRFFYACNLASAAHNEGEKYHGGAALPAGIDLTANSAQFYRLFFTRHATRKFAGRCTQTPQNSRSDAITKAAKPAGKVLSEIYL